MNVIYPQLPPRIAIIVNEDGIIQKVISDVTCEVLSIDSDLSKLKYNDRVFKMPQPIGQDLTVDIRIVPVEVSESKIREIGQIFTAPATPDAYPFIPEEEEQRGK